MDLDKVESNWHGWPPQIYEDEKWRLAKERSADVDLDKVTATYLKIREARKAKKKEWEAEDQRLKDQLDILAGFFLQTFKTLNVESHKTRHGTVYRSMSVTPQGVDWNKFYSWIAENNAFDALERRIKKTFIKTYMEDHKDELPPGVTVFKEYTVTVRRGKGNLNEPINEEEDTYDDN